MVGTAFNPEPPPSGSDSVLVAWAHRQFKALALSLDLQKEQDVSEFVTEAEGDLRWVNTQGGDAMDAALSVANPDSKATRLQMRWDGTNDLGQFLATDGTFEAVLDSFSGQTRLYANTFGVNDHKILTIDVATGRTTVPGDLMTSGQAVINSAYTWNNFTDGKLWVNGTAVRLDNGNHYIQLQSAGAFDVSISGSVVSTFNNGRWLWSAIASDTTWSISEQYTTSYGVNSQFDCNKTQTYSHQRTYIYQGARAFYHRSDGFGYAPQGWQQGSFDDGEVVALPPTDWGDIIDTLPVGYSPARNSWEPGVDPAPRGMYGLIGDQLAAIMPEAFSPPEPAYVDPQGNGVAATAGAWDSAQVLIAAVMEIRALRARVAALEGAP